MTGLSRAGLGAGLLAAGLAAADPPKPADPAGTAVEVVSFDPAGPVRVWFEVLIDGKPAEAVWAEAADKLFALCDRNGDELLDAEERAAFNRLARSTGDEPDAPRDDDRPPAGDGNPKFDREAFVAGLRATGLGAVRVAVRPARSDPATDPLFAFPDRDGDGKLPLYDVADRNGDGKLGQDELEAALKTLEAVAVSRAEVTVADLGGGCSSCSTGMGTAGSRRGRC